MTNLANGSGVSTKSYKYDAFGNETNPSTNDTNCFRYCGEYWDNETKTYYLRHRNFVPENGRFTQADTHWNTSNMIFGDEPRKINRRKDALGLTVYTWVPDLAAMRQSGNLYNYCMGNPLLYVDPSGNVAVETHWWGISVTFTSAEVGAIAAAICVGGTSIAIVGELVSMGIITLPAGISITLIGLIIDLYGGLIVLANELGGENDLQ